MSDNIFDLYVDYLLSSFGLTTAAGLSAVLEKQISHDRIARMLSGREKTSADLFRYVLTDVRFASAENMMFIRHEKPDFPHPVFFCHAFFLRMCR